MKTKFITLFKPIGRVVISVILLTHSITSWAQSPFVGGQTYWVNGIGVDVVSPKDTFVNLTGAYTAGAAYTNTTGVLSALNAQGVDPTALGTINILLVSGYTGIETNRIDIGNTITGGFPFMSSQRNIVIKPDVGFNVTLTRSAGLAANESVIRFNGAQFVTLDGAGSIGQRNLTVRMPSGSNAGTTKVIDIISTATTGCQSVIIKNCNITGLSTSGALASIGTYAGIYSGGAGAPPTAPLKISLNLEFTNNEIVAVQNGIYVRGIENAAGRQDAGLIISNNIMGGYVQPILGEVNPTTFIGGTNAAGITLISQKNAVVQNNTIRNSLPSVGNFRGISLATAAAVSSLDSNVTITGNKIYNLRTTAAGAGVYGIRVSLGTHTLNLKNLIVNNTISNLVATSSATTITGFLYPIGILIDDNSANAGLEVYHNSIHLYGDTLVSGSFSACFATGANTSGGVRVGNNIFVNRMGRALSSTGANAASYIYYIGNNNSPFSTNLRNNAYYVNNTTGAFPFIGFFRAKSRTSLSEWKLAVTDTNSLTRIPPFVGNDDTTLTISNGAASLIGNFGASLGVMTDINGVSRSSSTPSAGAYEFSGNSLIANFALIGGGTYSINGTNAWPIGGSSTGSFATLSDAVTYLNTFGTSGTGNIVFELSPGYVGESRIIPAILRYNGVNSSRPIVIRPSAGNSYTISAPSYTNIFNQYALISTIGASYVTINGESVTGERNLTLALPASLNSNNIKVVSIGSTDSISTTDISILNCNIIGSSTTTAINTAFGIYQGYFNPATAFQNAVIGLNNNMVFTNNYIQAVRSGIHIRGTNTPGRQNRTLLITKNIIGGTVKRGDGAPLTYLGGAADQAGIYVKSVSFVTLDSNIIRNSDSSLALSNGFRGIDIDAGGSTTALDSSVSITRNTIYNLTTATGAYCVGIRVNLANANSRRLYIVNNSIAKIRGVGSASGGSATNPAGIQIDGSGTVTNLGLEMYQNTVQLSGNTLTGTNSSYCLFFGGAIQGGVNLQNNLLTNRLGRVSTLGGFSYGMFSNTTLANSPFRLITNGSINSNAYGAEANNTNNFIVGNTTANYQFMQQWSTVANQDFNSFNFAAFFANDSTPFPNLALAGRIANGSLRIPSIANDIMGNVRSGTFTSTGALQFVATFLPLAGNSVYKINGQTNLPTGLNTPPYSFATINRAFEYINSNGVDAVSAIPQPITLLIEAGYIGEGDTLIAPLGSYPNANSSRPITLKNDFGRNDTIRTLGILMPYQANGSVLRFVGASFFTIDGSADGSGSRNITIMLPSVATSNSLKLIDLTSGEKAVSNITIRNCNLVGNVNATINTFAGIYMGGILATPSNPTIGKNNDNTFDNNFIVGVRNGIYAQGFTTNFNQHDLRLRLRRNIIGGVGSALTDRFGGVANAAGIYVNAQAITTIDSNVVRNNAPAFTLNRGIELGSTTTARTIDSAISVTRNTIQNITSNLASAGAYGIFVSLLSDSFNNITIANNMISGIKAAGTVSVTSYSNISPFGIWVESSGTVNNIGLNIWNNSINLGLGNTLGTTSNAVSSCIGFNNSVRGGVALRNNILQNRLGRSAAGTGTASSIVIGSTTTIFSVCDNNIYHSLAPNTTNNIGVFNAFTNPDRDSTLAMWIDATKQDSMSVSINTNFTNDTTLTILPTNTAILRGWPISAVSTDLTGDVRDIFNPTIGADEISGGIPVDSSSPNVFNLTKLPSTCSNGPYPIIYRVFTRQNNIRDTLFYSVNGLPEVFITTPSVSGYTRVYTIPAQLPNSSIAYRLSISTVSSPNFTVNLPATGYEYISTTFDAFPITEGFDGPNVNGWTVQSEGPNGPTSPAAGGWILGSFGSASNPVVTPATGIKAALFPSNTLPKNTLSRLISPCLDLTNTKIPTVRIWVSQNSDLLTRLDRIRVSASTGFGWSQLAFIDRPNPSLPFPEFTKLDVCLANFVGINGVRIAIEGLSDNGQNIVLDSIVIFDDILPTTFTPTATTICSKDPLTVSLVTSSANYTYELVDAFTGLSVGDPIKGTGSALSVTAPNPSNTLVGRVDSIWVVVKYTNISSACQYFLTDTSKITIRSFFNGPFITEGIPYTGAFLNGTILDPDGARNQDTLNYTILAPSDLANAGYGSTWTIVNQSVATATGTPISNAVLFPASSLTDARYRIITGVSDLDSVFILKATLRLLPSNCDSLITRYIKVVSAPVASFTNASDSVCSGAPIGFLNTTTFDVKTAPITYVWNFGDGTSSFTRDAFKVYSFNTAAGVYTVKLTATNNAGVSTEYSKQIRVLPAPVPSYTTTLACGSDSIPFTNNSTGASSYLWTSRLNGATVATSTETNPKFSFAFSDTVYNVTLRATNTLGCNRDTTVGVFSFAKPIASFSVANHCLGLNASFNNTSTIIPGSNGRVNSFGSAWDFGNGQIGLSNSPVYRYPLNGTYTVKLRTTSNYGCTDSVTGTVTVFDKPRTGFTNGPACQDAAVAINNTTTYSGGASNVLYTWDFGDFSPNSTDFNPTKAYGAKGLYNLTLVAHDAINGCYDTTVKSIEVNEAPLALYSVGNGCKGTPLQFSNGSIPPVGQPNMTFNWNFGDGNSSTSPSPLHTYTGIGVFNITLEATTSKGCKNIAQIAKDTVVITSSPDATFTHSNVTSNIIKFVPGIKGAAGYKWVFGDGSESPANDTITNIYQTKGVYTVKLTITNINGCQGTFTDTVHIDYTIGFKEEFESKFNLSVYPNPFENNATVSYNLDSKQDVKVTVLDVLGRKVSEVIENNQSAGNHSIKLEESIFTATSALYMVRIQIGNETITKQLLHK